MARLVNINWTIFWQVFNFIILLVLLIKYLYDPLLEILDKRAENIRGNLEEARQEKEEAEQLKKEYEQKLQDAREQAQDIIEEAERRGKKKRREIVKNAKNEAEVVKQNKLKEVERAKREAANELKEEVASISLQAAQKIINENLNKNKQEDLIDQFIENLDKEKIGEIQ